MFQITPTPAPTTSTSNPLTDMIENFGNTVEATISAEFQKIKEQIKKDLFELEGSTRKLSANLGRGADFAFGMRQSFADAMPSVIKLGGSIKDIADIQEGVIKSTGRGVQLAGDEFEKFYASIKVVKTTADEMIGSFKNIGVSVHDAAKETEKIVMTASKLGLNVEQVYSNVTGYIDKINMYNFQGGVEGLTKMAAKATSLRISMSETFGFADKVMNPEGAIEMANAFQRLGAGTSALLDPLKLMDLSMNDPEELQNQLIKMTQQYTKFNSETGRFEITNKRMFRELAKELGMSYNELTKMALGGAELNKKLSEIKFPKDAVSEEDREMIANMAEFKQGQGYVVRVMEDGQMKEKKVTELSPENLDYLRQQPKSIEEIQKQSLDTATSMAADIAAIRAAITGGVARSRTSERILRSGRVLTETLETFVRKMGVTPKNVGGVTDAFAGGLQEAFKGNFSKLGDILTKFDPSKSGISFDQMKNEFRAIITSHPDYVNMNKNIGSKGAKDFLEDMMSLFEKQAKKGSDFIITKGGEFVQSDFEDVMIGVKENKLLGDGKGDQKIEKSSQVVGNTVPISTETRLTDFIEKLMVTMKTPMEPNRGGVENNRTSFEPMQIDLNLNVSGVNSPDVTTALIDALNYNKAGLSNAILNAVNRVQGNNGLTDQSTKKGTPTK